MATRLNQKYITGGVSGPHTNRNAYAVDERPCAIGETIITVVDANYRLAKLNGSFIVKDQSGTVRVSKSGVRFIEIDCKWYQWRPQKDSLRLLVRNNENVSVATSQIICITEIGEV